MFPKINPTSIPSWHALKNHFAEMKIVHMKDLFAQDAKRFEKFSLSMGDILFDYTKNIITEKTMQLLLELAGECELKQAIEAMFNGEKINETEN
ncbi:MAG TPA: hypothetical protein VK484_10465, partial [Ferruginibacter sp.]|nr:hypothetical protein [Ferruginibacter sp.]